MPKFSWTFSTLENGLRHLEGLAEDGLTAIHVDMHPLALGQMLASEFLAMLERRAQEETTTATPSTPEPAPSVTAATEEPAEVEATA